MCTLVLCVVRSRERKVTCLVNISVFISGCRCAHACSTCKERLASARQKSTCCRACYWTSIRHAVIVHQHCMYVCMQTFFQLWDPDTYKVGLTLLKAMACLLAFQVPYGHAQDMAGVSALTPHLSGRVRIKPRGVQDCVMHEGG